MPKIYAKPTTSAIVPDHFFKQKKSSAWYVRLVPSETLRTKFGMKEFRKSASVMNTMLRTMAPTWLLIPKS